MASAGQVLDPWQQDVVHAALATGPDGKWINSEVAVIVPRQNGKGAILEALAMAGLLLCEERLILWSAHEFKTCREAFIRVRDLIERSPHLKAQVKSIRTGAGDEGITLKSGQRIRFIARSRGSGRGFSPDRVILDEAYELTDDALAALMPALSARPNAQIVYASSAPLPTSTALRRICIGGRRQRPGLTYFEWCADRDASPDDWRAVCEANPAFPDRIGKGAVIREIGAMGEEEVLRERLGIWYEEGSPSVIDPKLWAALAEPDSTILGKVALALDTTPNRSHASLAVSGRRADGLGHLEVIRHDPGTGWVVPAVVEFVAKHKPCAIVLDPAGPAGSFLPELEEEGIEVVTVQAREVAQACGGLEDNLLNKRYRHIDQAPLNLALQGAVKRDLSDAWAWSRKHSSIDISPLVAVTLAAYGFSVYGVEPDYDLLDSVL